MTDVTVKKIEYVRIGRVLGEDRYDLILVCADRRPARSPTSSFNIPCSIFCGSLPLGASCRGE